MQRACILIVGLGLLALCGCKPKDAAPASSEAAAEEPWWSATPSRYQGVGIYAPDRLWTKLAGAPAPKDPAAARTSDDGEIIVVVDNHTGEIRQCGNLSGVCVSLNPWGKASGRPPQTPLALTEHAPPMTPDANPADAGRRRGRRASPIAARSEAASSADPDLGPATGSPRQ